jgi:hypothetical protein
MWTFLGAADRAVFSFFRGLERYRVVKTKQGTDQAPRSDLRGFVLFWSTSRFSLTSMGEPHRHHFIPAFYLKHWAAAGGKLVEFTKYNGKLVPRHRGPEKTGYEENLYTFPDLPPAFAADIETKMLKQHDESASKALEKFLSGDRCPLTNDMRSDWARFLVGLRLRHPDAMPEVKAGIKRVWDNSAGEIQESYERNKKADHPSTFDEFLHQQDATYFSRIQQSFIASAFDNEFLGNVVVNMLWGVMDVSDADNDLLTSDWPVELAFQRGILSLPISPTKIFVAANTRPLLQSILRGNPSEVVKSVNIATVSQARRHVWSGNDRQRRFIENRMSRQMVPQPLFPTFANL